MRGLFRRSSTLQPPARWRQAAPAACLGALGVACLLATGCGLAPHAATPAATAQPTHADASTSCAGLRQLLSSHNVAPTPTLGSGGHRVYDLNELGPLPPHSVWQAGATMRFSWCAIPAQTTTDAQAQPERVTLKILGPFDSMGVASQVGENLSSEMQMATPGSSPSSSALAALGPVAASAPALTTDTWSDADLSTTLQLPSTPKTAFYVFLAQDEALSGSGPDAAPVAGQGGLSVGIIQVGAA